jgi:hypothetical protein
MDKKRALVLLKCFQEYLVQYNREFQYWDRIISYETCSDWTPYLEFSQSDNHDPHSSIHYAHNNKVRIIAQITSTQNMIAMMQKIISE